VAWDRGDFSATDWAHPEIEYVIVDGSSRRRSTGLSGMAMTWRRFLADWEDWRAQTTEVRELDSERVLALVNLSGRNRASGFGSRKSAARRARTCFTSWTAR
jgi:hypothetical protein